MVQQFIPFENVCRVDMIYTCQQQRCVNVYNYKLASGWDESKMQELAAALCDWETDDAKSLRHNSTQLTLIQVTELTTQNSTAIEYSTGLPITGTSGVNTLPNNVTAAITWRTAQRGRSFRGRTYHIGLYPDAISGQNLTSNMIAALVAAYTDLIEIPIGASAAFLQVASRQANNVARVTGLPTEVVSCQVNAVLDSQRRRLPGRGT